MMALDRISFVASIPLQSLFSPKQLFEINEFRESSNFAAHIKQISAN